MSSSRTIRGYLCLLLSLAAFLSAQGAAAQTVLLVVVETANSQALPPPLAVREGVSASLFDAGCIVLDAPGSGKLPAPADIARLARSAGAERALEVATDYADTSLEAGVLRISARTTYTLIDTATNGVLTRGTREASNRDRERDVTRASLGAEIGRDIVQALHGFLGSRDGG